MAAFQNISAEQALALLSNDPQAIILDCRELKDYRAGHIDNAMHVHEQLRDSLLRKGDKQRPLLIYCYHGHTSQHLAAMFCDFGFHQVYSLIDGYVGWQKHHSPL